MHATRRACLLKETHAHRQSMGEDLRDGDWRRQVVDGTNHGLEIPEGLIKFGTFRRDQAHNLDREKGEILRRKRNSCWGFRLFCLGLGYFFTKGARVFTVKGFGHGFTYTTLL